MLMAYCYALLNTRGYVRRFEEELRTPGPRVPITRDSALFRTTASHGEELLGLHTYAAIGVGDACIAQPVGEPYPSRYAHDPGGEALSVGDGRIEPVSQAAWDYAVSGYRVIPSYLRRRLAARPRSELETIRPRTWTASETRELLDLVWVIERTLVMEPVLDRLLDEVIATCVALPGPCQAVTRYRAATKLRPAIAGRIQPRASRPA
jgi:hypothetical protein